MYFVLLHPVWSLSGFFCHRKDRPWAIHRCSSGSVTAGHIWDSVFQCDLSWFFAELSQFTGCEMRFHVQVLTGYFKWPWRNQSPVRSLPCWATILPTPLQTSQKTEGSELWSISFNFPVKMASILPFLQLAQIQISWFILSFFRYLKRISHLSVDPTVILTRGKIVPENWLRKSFPVSVTTYWKLPLSAWIKFPHHKQWRPPQQFFHLQYWEVGVMEFISTVEPLTIINSLKPMWLSGFPQS